MTTRSKSPLTAKALRSPGSSAKGGTTKTKKPATRSKSPLTAKAKTRPAAAAKRGLMAKPQAPGKGASPEARANERLRSSASGAKPVPLDLAGLKAPGRLEAIDPAQIEPNPHNPRRVDVEKEAQRTFEESIATQGILEPVLVAPSGSFWRRASLPETGSLPKTGASGASPVSKAPGAPYVLVAGARRFKAALKAIAAKRLPAGYRIPAMVKALDNRQARLAALAENLARADMHPLDECREFAAAADAGSAPDEIAAIAGAHLRNVQRRIKVWRDLPEDGKKAFAAGKIGFAQAHAIAQIPDETLRDTVLRETLKGGKWCNEDWIDRRWKSIKRSRARAKERRAEDKKNPRAAAERKARTGGHTRQREFPKPDAAGMFAWPKKGAGYRDGVDLTEIKGEVLRLELVTIDVDKKREVSGFRYSAGPLSFEEPLRLAAAAPARNYGALAAHEERALAHLVDKVLGEPKPLPSLDRRKLGADIAHAIDEITAELGTYDPKVRKQKTALLERLHDKLLQVLSPARGGLTGDAKASHATTGAKAPASAPPPGARPAGGGPMAAPDKSAPLTAKLDVPASAGNGKTLTDAVNALLLALEEADVDLQLYRNGDTLSVAYRDLCRAVGREPALTGIGYEPKAAKARAA